VALRTQPAGARGAALLSVLLLAACGGPRPDLEETVDRYILAVQERDTERLISLGAGIFQALRDAPEEKRAGLRAAYEEMLDSRHEAYATGRDEGWLEFTPDGVVLIRALNLGRGTYYETTATEETGPGRARLIQEVRLAYRAIDLSTLPAGTTIYLLGLPLGTVYRPVIGGREPAVRQVLERIWLRWELVFLEGAWRVEKVEPDPRPPWSYTDSTRY
jgi:hypothetical protein